MLGKKKTAQTMASHNHRELAQKAMKKPTARSGIRHPSKAGRQTQPE